MWSPYEVSKILRYFKDHIILYYNAINITGLFLEVLKTGNPGGFVPEFFFQGF